MEKKSRVELLKIIETQKEQLVRFENRLRDVVHAYKNLLKEKEAIEASVKILTVAQHGNKSTNKLTNNSELVGNDEKEGDEKGDLPLSETQTSDSESDSGGQTVAVQGHPLTCDEEGPTKEMQRAEDSGGDENCKKELETLKEQVSTLSQSLATVMEQKSKMEANYQADKKKMMQEHEDKVREHSKKSEQLDKTVEKLEEQVQQLRLRTRNEQQAREEEQNNHALMLRELQQLFSTERLAREELEKQLEEAKTALTSRSIPDSQMEGYELCIAELRTELEDVREKLSKYKEHASHPSPMLLELQEEMAKMKQESADAVVREQKRANEAEERLQSTTTAEESRVADLESKLSELSEVVGSYERLRLQDQIALQKLRDRLQQLDVENTALSMRETAEPTEPDNKVNENDENETLKEQISKLKGLLRLAIQKPVDEELEQLSKSELESMLVSDPTHKACQSELKQLKDEFERYKLKTQSLYKNKSFKELSTQMENLDKLKDRNAELEKRLHEVREYSETKEKDLHRVNKELQDRITQLESNHKRELDESNLVYQHKLSELEKQVHKQRDRTLSLLAEKDAELESLRIRSPSFSPSGGVESGSAFSYPRRFMDGTQPQTAGYQDFSADRSETESVVHQLVSRPATVSSGESSLVHYAQQQARREAENFQLRKTVYRLEDALRGSEQGEAKLLEQVQLLKEEVRKQERDKTRESANMEYVKNVVLRFMLSDLYSVKQQMITAISTILQFSPKELSRVRKFHSSGWWPSSGGASAST